jgi:hypothetical protein
MMEAYGCSDLQLLRRSHSVRAVRSMLSQQHLGHSAEEKVRDVRMVKFTAIVHFSTVTSRGPVTYTRSFGYIKNAIKWASSWKTQPTYESARIIDLQQCGETAWTDPGGVCLEYRTVKYGDTRT